MALLVDRWRSPSAGEGQLGPELSALRAQDQSSAEGRLRAATLDWLEQVLGQPLPEAPLEELLANAWVLGRVAEVLGAYRAGKSARLGPGEVSAQVQQQRPYRATLADFQSYCQLFEELSIQTDNLVSLGDLTAGRRAATVCRSLWDLQIALSELGVQGVPEFDSGSLRRGMLSAALRTNSLQKAALFEGSAAAAKAPGKPMPPALAVHGPEEEVSPDKVISLGRWLPGEEEGGAAGEEEQGQSATSPWRIGSAPAAVGAAPAAGSPEVAGQPPAVPRLSLSPLEASPGTTASPSAGGGASPGQHRLTPGRLQALATPNPAFSPAPSPGRPGSRAAGAEPLRLKLSPPSDSERGSPGAADDFVNVLVSPEKPEHVRLMSALLNTTPQQRVDSEAGSPPLTERQQRRVSFDAAARQPSPHMIRLSSRQEAEAATSDGGEPQGGAGRRSKLPLLLAGAVALGGALLAAAGAAQRGTRGGQQGGARRRAQPVPPLKSRGSSWDSPRAFSSGQAGSR